VVGRLSRHDDVMHENVASTADDELTPPRPSAKVRQAVTQEVANLQGAHYDRLIDLYEEHATEPSTQKYRRRFIDEPLLRGIELEGRAVLEAMCGSGHSTGLLLERGARVTGLDVSEQAIELFRAKWPQCEAVVESILASTLAPGSFDVVVVVGGLHHVHPHVEEAAEQIWKLLKPGGYFCFSEPHTGSLMNFARRLWYARDPMFESNEAAIDVEMLRQATETKFDVVTERYYGNVAHTLVLNSMVLRTPRWVKRLYAEPAMAAERLLNPVLGRRLSCSVLCQWRRRG
jgi:2-polyprenyl-3-methyl-5-hydroxy-6-metoxy-1,4-benzoquinol methylase